MVGYSARSFVKIPVLGVSVCENECTTRYSDATGLAKRVSRLNPAWNETDPEITPDRQFDKAVQLCGEDFSAMSKAPCLVLCPPMNPPACTKTQSEMPVALSSSSNRSALQEDGNGNRD